MDCDHRSQRGCLAGVIGVDLGNKFLKDKRMNLVFNAMISRFKRMCFSKKAKEGSGTSTFLKQKSSLADKPRMINATQRLT